MSDDLIKRNIVIATIGRMYEVCTTRDITDYRNLMLEAVEVLPSADRPQGEWVDEADKYDASFGIHDYRCSNCNSYADEYIGGHEWYTAGKPNFCPYCGADMREREGE